MLRRDRNRMGGSALSHRKHVGDIAVKAFIAIIQNNCGVLCLVLLVCGGQVNLRGVHEGAMGQPPRQTPLHTAMTGIFRRREEQNMPPPSLAPVPPVLPTLPAASSDEEDSSSTSALWSTRMPAPQAYTPPIAIKWVPGYDESPTDSIEASVAPTVAHTLSTPWPTQDVLEATQPSANTRPTPMPTPGSRPTSHAPVHPADPPASVVIPAPGLVEQDPTGNPLATPLPASDSSRSPTVLSTGSPSHGTRDDNNAPLGSTPSPAAVGPTTEETRGLPTPSPTGRASGPAESGGRVDMLATPNPTISGSYDGHRLTVAPSVTYASEGGGLPTAGPPFSGPSASSSSTFAQAPYVTPDTGPPVAVGVPIPTLPIGDGPVPPPILTPTPAPATPPATTKKETNTEAPTAPPTGFIVEVSTSSPSGTARGGGLISFAPTSSPSGTTAANTPGERGMPTATPTATPSVTTTPTAMPSAMPSVMATGAGTQILTPTAVLTLTPTAAPTATPTREGRGGIVSSAPSSPSQDSGNTGNEKPTPQTTAPPGVSGTFEPTASPTQMGDKGVGLRPTSAAYGTTAPRGGDSPSPTLSSTIAPSGGGRDAGTDPSIVLTIAPTAGEGTRERGGSFSPTAAAVDRGSTSDTPSPQLPLLVSR